MEHQVSWEIFEKIRTRLSEKGYIEVRPINTYEFAMMKQTFGGTLPKVISIIDATMTTNSPKALYEQHQAWFKKLLGNTGAGVMLFIYLQPSANLVSEVSQLGKGLLGDGQVVAGVYDVSSNQYWLSGHMGWPDEIFG